MGIANHDNTDVIMDDDKIGIHRIKLTQPQHGLHAILHGFFEANRVLARWATLADVPQQFDFEIVFTNGALMRGLYDPRKKRRRGGLSLNAFIMHCLQPRGMQQGELFDGSGNSIKSTFLQQYEITNAPPG